MTLNPMVAWPFPASSPAEKREREYQDHIKREGRGPVNEHPDGCYFCGSSSHHSGDCQERE